MATHALRSEILRKVSERNLSPIHYSVELFVVRPVHDELICAICSDVLCEARSAYAEGSLESARTPWYVVLGRSTSYALRNITRFVISNVLYLILPHLAWYHVRALSASTERSTRKGLRTHAHAT